MNHDTAVMEEMLRWAIGAEVDPARAAADWIARDIDERYHTAEALLTDPAVPLAALERAKSAYKTMRIVGESAADRRLGARLYAATIAAALVWHGVRISRQSDAALRRAFSGLQQDSAMAEALRALARRGLRALPEEAPR